MIIIGLYFRFRSAVHTWRFWHTLYSKNTFEELTANDNTWGKKQLGIYGIVALAGGALLLFIFTTYSHVGFVLWGLAGVLMGISALAVAAAVPEAALRKRIPEKKKRQQLTFMRYFLMSVAPAVIVILYILPLHSILSDDYIVLTIIGVILLCMGIISVPIAVWRIASEQMVK